MIHCTTRLISTEAQKIGKYSRCKGHCSACPTALYSLLYFNRNEDWMTGVSGLHRISIILKSPSTIACGNHFKFGSTSSSSRNTYY